MERWAHPLSSNPHTKPNCSVINANNLKKWISFDIRYQVKFENLKFLTIFQYYLNSRTPSLRQYLVTWICAYDYKVDTTKIKTNKAIIHFESQYELQSSQTYNTI